MVNWNEITNSLKNQEGSAVTTDPARWNLDTPGYNEIFKIWKDANFNSSAIKWINYYPETHYDNTVVEAVAKSLNLKGIHRSWISRIDPGYMAPWHWDVDDNEQGYLKVGPIIRYTVIIKDFTPGQLFILKDKHFFNVSEGVVIPWESHRNWHSGINGSMKTNWMFHILGY